MKLVNSSRYSFSGTEIRELLKSLKEEKKTYVQYRRIVALCLMHATGLKPEVIITLSRGQVELLFKEGHLDAELSTFGLLDRVSLSLSLRAEGKSFLEEHSYSLELLYYLRKADSYVFSSLDRPGETLSLEVFERDLLKTINRFKGTSKSRKQGKTKQALPLPNRQVSATA